MPAATVDQLEQYRQQGCFRIKEFAGPDVGEAMRDRVIALTRAAAGGTNVSPALVMFEQQAGYADGRAPEEIVSKIFRLHRDPVFEDFVRSPAVVELVRSVLGIPDIACFLSQFIFKNPGAWGQPWHQDSFYFPFDPPRPIVGIWLAVSEATLENGCLHVLAGSHDEPIHDHIDDRRPGANLGYVEIVDHDMTNAEPVCMDPGELLVFDSHLMHRSKDNTSAAMRAAMVFHFAAAATADHTEANLGYTVNDWMPMEPPTAERVRKR